MQMIEVSDKSVSYIYCQTSNLLDNFVSCQYFILEHSPEYQQVQFSFLDAVNTYDPNAIGVSY